MKLFRDSRVFLRQFFVQYHTTGSVLPSSKALANALCRYAAGNGATPLNGPREILEVGPGTGAVTARLVTKLRPTDRLTLVELNDDFVDHLHKRFDTEKAFKAVANQTQILKCRVEELTGEHRYHALISGLPLNNFTVAEVEQILDLFQRVIRPGGTLSFFEYIAIRRVKSLVSGPTGRHRLRGIGNAIQKTLQGREIKCDWVWPNVPPAWVHHVKFGESQ
jgi:phospholipid N-methyltransferase